MNWIVACDEPVTAATPLGGKARSLWALGRAGFPVPPWLAVLPAACAVRPGDAADEETLRQRMAPASLAPEQAAALRARLDRLAPGCAAWAVRSSAADEDDARNSFAGQLASFLEVTADDVPARVADVWRSGFTSRVCAYRRERGLPFPPPVPAVIVQAMVPAETAGVAFSADAVTGRWSHAVVAAVRGLGEALVSGECNADTFKVARDGAIVERQTAVADAAPILDDARVAAVAALARRAEAHYGCPQDIEWAWAGGRLHLLQSRPITSMDRLADPDGLRLVWDNSNIAESYCGVTTPLTFSFARYIYEEVYRQLFRLLGVSRRRLAEHDDLFGRMLGLIRGRIYYSLPDWYRALALLPGFTFNRRFMEQMMGVKEGLPPDMVARLSSAGAGARFGDFLNFLSTVAGLLRAHRRLPRLQAAFRRRLDEALRPPDPPLALCRADELAAHYRLLERRLLRHWDAPLVNDFFAMFHFGLLRKLCASWLGPDGEFLANDLVGGGGGMVSTEPARRVEEMARMAARDPVLTALLADGPPEEALAAVQVHPELGPAFRDYLERFGARCMEELKLESPTLREDSTTLLRALGRLARRGAAPARAPYDARARAEQRVRDRLARRPVRRWLFGRVLDNARRRVRERENLRLDRTRLFARVRDLFKELGRRLTAVHRLDRPGDIFYLTVQEALGFVEGTAVTTDLRALTALRRREFDGYRAGPPPADRFETHGMVYVGNPFQAARAAAQATGESARGLACCPGIVRGRVRVVTDPRGVELVPGEILVAERTDPGWVMLFPAAAGLVVEHGSLLSHSAIVSRELGLPSVIALAGATTWLKTGDFVELDGARGEVRRLPDAEAPHAQ